VGLKRKMDPVTLILEIILLGFIVVFGFLAVEFKRLVYAAVSLALMSISIALVFFLLTAPFVGLLQLLIYVGAITILFLATISLTKGEEEE
jgi:NADH-quinone oxidoreductase subunit J